MVVQWYPGHMNKAKNQIQERLKLVDIVLEIRDARLPLSSRNPVLDQIINNKPRIIILNKADLADPKLTQAWLDYFNNQKQPSIALDAQHHNKLQQIRTIIEQTLQAKINKYQRNGVKNYVIRTMCIGIPNVGKSTILNKLVGKNIAVTGNKPGVTKNQNWLKAKNNLELLDTPGVLWPKIEDEQIGLKLALSGAVKDQLVNLEDLAIFALQFWQQNYSDLLLTKYHLSEAELQLTPSDLLIHLTNKWGVQEDYERAAQRVIQDVRQGNLGQYTLDEVVNDQL
ncbi:ribosome biogenesis GTPase YlqF [Bombilactobacillus thymidiniphilus]|uniref:Ribosome biogenesis GTPase A n=1 Tax=Bombilactobacillus thymidiniphilus TaxID=2923363 RepID=A0ABY4PDX9_9LACO|nr:ribosome biogenesis GTPase YlqF [Bombilactobacillus thymidiniphilus]UQS83706.1 ribosome biogenesis GTPase YlqF [Bombilactobacillus thymidiniphilus]